MSCNFQGRMHSMNLSPLTTTAMKIHFQHLAISAVWDGLLLQTHWHQVALLWFPRRPARSPRATSSPSKTIISSTQGTDLKKNHLLGELEQMSWCQPGCACCAGTRPLFFFPKGFWHMVQRFAVSLIKAGTPSCLLLALPVLPDLAAFFLASRNSQWDLPSGNMVSPNPFLLLIQSCSLTSLLKNQVRTETG